MPINNSRIYYATQMVAVTSDLDCTTFTTGSVVHGLQTLGRTVSFNTENINEYGQIDTYVSVENRPDVNVTMERVLDGYPLAYWLATAHTSVIANNSFALGARTNYPCKIAIGLFPDTQTVASGTASATVIVSGAYVDGLDYNIPIEGNATESVTFVANDSVWYSGSTDWFDYDFTGLDAPQTLIGLAGTDPTVMRRWNVDMTNSLWPKDIRGIASDNQNDVSGSTLAAHIQDIAISTSLGRTDLNEQGRRAPYYRYANFPVDVTCSIGTNSGDGDWKSVYANQNNLANQIIDIYIDDEASDHTLRFYLGTKNKLTSLDYSGGDTGGGVLTVSYSYTNQNTLTITGTDDPAGSMA